MFAWVRLKNDLFQGFGWVKKGLLSGAEKSVRAMDRMKLRFKLHDAEQRLAESYRELGQYAFLKLESKPPDFIKGSGWTARIREIENRRAEREILCADHQDLNHEDEDHVERQESQSR